MKMSLERSMKRSRQQRLLIAETMNKRGIDGILAIVNDLMEKLVNVQREVLVLRSTLIERRIISEMELEQVRLQIKQFEDMRAKGLILGEKKEGE
jgi:hypothetical protein